MTDNIKKLLLGIIIVTILLCICISIDYAANDTITANETAPDIPDDVILLNGSYYSSEELEGKVQLQKVVTEKAKLPTITIRSKPSCGCNHKYTWHTRTYVNYCPYCCKYGVLTNLHKYPARFEQEISCSRCRSDWCGVCGKEKYSWSPKYLRMV